MKWPGCAHAHIHPLDMAWTGFSIYPIQVFLAIRATRGVREKSRSGCAAGAIIYMTRDHGKGNEEKDTKRERTIVRCPAAGGEPCVS